MPPFTTALLVAGYSIPQRSAIAASISSGRLPASAIAITWSRHLRYGDSGEMSVAVLRTMTRLSVSTNPRLIMPAIKTSLRRSR
jgi:hypothetical protein